MNDDQLGNKLDSLKIFYNLWRIYPIWRLMISLKTVMKEASTRFFVFIFTKVGFSFGSSYQNVQFSGSKEVLSLVNRTNCGQPGVWLFKVDTEEDMNEKRCETPGKTEILKKHFNPFKVITVCFLSLLWIHYPLSNQIDIVIFESPKS